MRTSEIKNLLRDNSNDIAFLIGNGINQHYKNDSISWSNLLLDLWRKYSFSPQTMIPEGISFTEFYDALEIQHAGTPNFSAILQKEVQNKMTDWNSDINQNLILNRIQEMNAPVLTTNFDKLIPNSMGLEFRRMEGTKFTDYYPWSCYYSDRVLDQPNEGFGVWYPNGMMKYHRSIKLGLSQYMGNVARARTLIHKNYDHLQFRGKNQNLWDGYKTWLHIVFNKSLFIFGLGLDETEVFTRWLLIERAKYFKVFPNRKQKGWYLTRSTIDSSISEGKRFFLKSVGIEIIEVQDYRTIYEDIWH
ncbi:MAG: hypothetical protein QM503_00135 [Bacteroidota bacterium]